MCRPLKQMFYFWIAYSSSSRVPSSVRSDIWIQQLCSVVLILYIKSCSTHAVLLLMFNPGLCVVGLVLVLLIKPGVAYAVRKDEAEDEESFSTVDALLDLVRWEESVLTPFLVSLHIQFSKVFRSVSAVWESAGTSDLLSFRVTSTYVFLKQK